MPRPKRTKVASTAARVAKPSVLAEPPTSAQKPSKSRTKAVAKPVDSFGDQSDQVAVRSTRTRRQALQAQPQEEANHKAKGAPSREDQNHTPPSHTVRRTRVSKGGVQASSGRKHSGTETPPKSAQKETSLVELEEGDSSGFGDHWLSFTSLDSNSPAHGTRPPSAIKVGATPAHEQSILALTNFKRRPRQPSLLRMVHQTTDLEDNDGEDMDLYADDLEDCEYYRKLTPARAMSLRYLSV